MRYYDIEVAGTKRALKLCPINQDLCIAAFLILGDTELTVNCAAALLERAPKYDFLLTAEAKSIPLVQEMARQNGDAHYIVARKGRKLYMDNPICVGVKSITTEKDQKLYVDQEEMEQMRGKRILIVDDVISTGRSLQALEEIAAAAGADVVGKMAVLAEGDAASRTDISYLENFRSLTARANRFLLINFRELTE